jgi:hypothetical protein
MPHPVQRKAPRFDTDVKLSFTTAYDFRTEVDYTVDSEKKRGQAQTYIGFSKNISVGGICFESPKELTSGEYLWIELHLPKHNKLIYIEGEVRWSCLATVSPTSPRLFTTGVLVKKVDGSNVEETIYFDEDYKVMWSKLLERVLGGFAQLNKKSFPSAKCEEK